MQKQIDAKINSATSRQRPTQKRMRVAKGMREDGYYMQYVQGILYALSEAHATGNIINYRYLKNIRSKAQVELLNFYGNAVKHSFSQESIQSSFDRDKESLQKLGINSLREWRFADEQKKQLLDHFSPSQVRKQNEHEQEIKELEMEVFNAKIPGFFPTPLPLIERMIALSSLKASDRVLEPSAGKGDILDVIKDQFPDIQLDAVERHSTLVKILILKGYNFVGSDFLAYQPEKKYDKIIMNPPFENGQDIDHVSHALNLLKPGGRVVAIMGEGAFFRQFKKDTNFRELNTEKNAYISEPIKEAFKTAFMSTGVNVRMVAINQDGSPIKFDTKEAVPTDETEEMELLELEAQAEIELLKMQVEIARKKKRSMDGTGTIDLQKLTYFRQDAWALKRDVDVLNFKYQR